ncbi:MAG: hypothetical protein AB1921_02270 [Thermodesulfobacteriota bacterium]
MARSSRSGFVRLLPATVRFFLVFALCFLCCCASRQPLPQNTDFSGREDLARALSLLGQARQNDCPICVEKLRNQAVDLLSAVFAPGRRFSATASCPLVRLSGTAGLTLSCPPFSGNLERGEPIVIFSFGTREEHLAGFAEESYTSRQEADQLAGAAPGAAFAGTLETSSFAYGDGPSFLLQDRENAVLVFIRLTDLAPIR